MIDFEALADNETISENLRKIYKLAAKKLPRLEGGALDASEPILHSPEEIKEIQTILLDEVRAGYAADSQEYLTMDQLKELTANRFTAFANDGFFNSVNGIGTSADPGSFNTAFVPISMMPDEVTAYYSSGGIARRIIDMKAKGLFVNGYKFEGENWTESELADLKRHADSKAIDRAIMNSLRDALLYGGSLLVPALRKDCPLSYEMTIDELLEGGYLEKDCLDYFWSADRWNAVLIPKFDISARDYLHPAIMYVPIAGLAVRTERASILRPKQLPYWGTLRQVGWGISDMEGWIRSVLAYNIGIEGIPVMMQQMSLMYRHIPLDGIIAESGAAAAGEFARDMAKQLVAWSNNSPRTFNSVGEIKVIERNFQNFDSLIQILRQDVGAQSEFSDSILFNTQSTGFSKNEEDVTLKKAEVIQNIGNEIIPQLQNIAKILVYSCFGPNSPQAKKVDSVRFSFDSPTILTNEEKNQAGQIFGSLITALTGSGLSAGDAISIAQSFTPDIDLPQEVLNRLNESASFGDSEVGQDGGGVDHLHQQMSGFHGGNESNHYGAEQLHQKISRLPIEQKKGLSGFLRNLLGGNNDSQKTA